MYAEVNRFLKEIREIANKIERRKNTILESEYRITPFIRYDRVNFSANVTSKIEMYVLDKMDIEDEIKQLESLLENKLNIIRLSKLEQTEQIIVNGIIAGETLGEIGNKNNFTINMVYNTCNRAFEKIGIILLNNKKALKDRDNIHTNRSNV